MSPATDGFSVMMRDLDMGQQSNSLTVALQVRAVLLRRGRTLYRVGRAVFCTPFVRRARSDAAYQKSLIQPSLTKYFPGNCLTRRFSSNCNSVDETAALGNWVRVAMSSIEVSTASIAS